MQDIRALVHKSHIEGSKVGPNSIFQLRENHPRLSQTASWPAPPEGETVRAGLWAALQQNRDPVMRARQAVVDEIMYLSDANMSEVNELLIFLSRLNPNNPAHVQDAQPLIDWLERDGIKERHQESFAKGFKDIDHFILATRKRGKRL